MLRYIIGLSLTLLFLTDLAAQNLVPNPGFEKCTNIPKRWISNRVQFDDWMEHWNTPNDGSPDILFVNVLKGLHPVRPFVDLRPYQPRSGKIMAGIKTYGCKSNTLHCREYIQVELIEPLVIGETYYAEFWVHAIANSIYHNHIGMAFSTAEHNQYFSGGMFYELPLVFAEDILSEQKWVKVSGKIVADEPYTHLLIGNFSTAENTTTASNIAKMSHAYYLLDDVLLQHEKRFKDLRAGTALVLENIFFETDKANLLPKSFAELDQLHAYLEEHKEVRIKLLGHTDNVGEDQYNMQLSIDRVEAVAAYLQSVGIASDRMEFEGLGASQPIANNNTEEGRQQNRRVEMMVLSK